MALILLGSLVTRANGPGLALRDRVALLFSAAASSISGVPRAASSVTPQGPLHSNYKSDGRRKHSSLSLVKEPPNKSNKPQVGWNSWTQREFSEGALYCVEIGNEITASRGGNKYEAW